MGACVDADRIRDELTAWMRGEGHRPADPAAFVDEAVRQELLPLLAETPAVRLLEPDLRERIHAAARRQAALTSLREHELRRVLDACADGRIPVLVIKGAHLSATCYPRSDLRTRHDTDLLVRAHDGGRIRRILARAGYSERPTLTGARVLGQSSFDKPEVAGLTLDVHWRASSRRVAAALFDFDDLWSRAVPLPRLGPHAFGPSPTDALALACVHLVAHHQHDDVLLWLYDVHLLIEHFSPEEARAFSALAVSRRMSRLCVTVIERAAGAFHGRRAGSIVETLWDAPPDEPSARLAGRRTPLSDLLSDLAVVRAPGEGLRLVLAHLFPPAAYMRTAFAPSSRAPLPWLYARRIVRGSVGWLAPRRQRGSRLGLGQRP